MTKHHSRIHASFAISIVTLACLGLSACGSKEEKAAPTQVAAKVGSEEISVHQINQALSRTNTANATPEAVAAMSREVLEKLIDQQIVVDQAIEDKLQRSPEVITRLEQARRDILAQAFVQQITSHLPKPTTEELKKYYTDHPQLFAERNIFNIQEITAENAPGVSDLLREQLNTNKPIEQIAADLKSKNIKFNGGNATRAAEQVPIDLLPKLQELKPGQALVLQSPQSVLFLRVVSRQSQPVNEEAALPKIEQFLANQRATQAVTDRMKQLRGAAKITYMGEFAKPAAAAASAPATPPAEAASTAKSALEKGIAGLK